MSISLVRVSFLLFLLLATSLHGREAVSGSADLASDYGLESDSREYPETISTDEQESISSGSSELDPHDELVSNEVPELVSNEVPELVPNEDPELDPSDISELDLNEVLEPNPNEALEANPNEVPESNSNDVPESNSNGAPESNLTTALPISPPPGDLIGARTLYVDPTQFPGAECARVCVAGQRRICYFEFVLEHYQAMGVACGNCSGGVRADCERPQCLLGDGVEKGVMSINRMVPGPAIQVCKDDVIVVDVVNEAGGTTATIHWHGLHMRDTPHMDGVPFITQCPIPFATTFRYEYAASQAGTQFYHSHSGHHKVNGQYGALIIRQPPSQQLNSFVYDHDLPEHHMVLSDWMHHYGEWLFPGVPNHGGLYPDAMLINGRGTYIDPRTFIRTEVPPTRYYVTSGQRYRFRLINAVSHACPVQLQVEGHSLTIVASDSYDVEPRPFDTLVSNAGERYDFVLTANYTEGDFWIRVRGMGLCEEHPTEAFALLRYRSKDVELDVSRPLPPMPNFHDLYQTGIILNHPNAKCFNRDNDHCVTELRSYEQDDDLHYGAADQKFYLSFHNYVVANGKIFQPGTYNHFANVEHNITIVGAINNLSLIFPPSPPLTQPRDLDESLFCDDDHVPERCKGEAICPCVHRIQIKRGNIVELVIIDETDDVGGLHHPFHLHGYRFMVTGLGQHPLGIPMTAQLAKEMDRTRSLPRLDYNPRPPFKDTVSIPSSGYAVVRFRADNPGYWLMHCHYEWHLSIGMGLVLQVGKQYQMVSPPLNFPQCGNYQPKVRRIF